MSNLKKRISLLEEIYKPKRAFNPETFQKDLVKYDSMEEFRTLFYEDVDWRKLCRKYGATKTQEEQFMAIRKKENDDEAKKRLASDIKEYKVLLPRVPAISTDEEGFKVWKKEIEEEALRLYGEEAEEYLIKQNL